MALYEIHHTISNVKHPDKFVADAKRYNIKPLVLSLQKPDSSEGVIDYITSLVINASFVEAVNHMTDVSRAFVNIFGYYIVREKIETLMGNLITLDSPMYFEAHIKVSDYSMGYDSLLAYAYENKLLLSQNTLKPGNHQMLMYRHVNEGIFNLEVDRMLAELNTGFQYVTVDRERVVYDSNPDHDKEWMNYYDRQTISS